MQNVSTFNLSVMALVGATALSTGMATGLTGCGSELFTTGTDPDAGLEAGDGGDSGGGDGGPVLGTQYIPKGVRPTLGQTLMSTHAYLEWSAPSAVPEGKTLDHFDVCWATGTVIALGDESECPNTATTQKTYSAIKSLTAGTQYFWKVRAGYTDGTTSYYSSALPFRTDNRLAAWWPMDETGGTTTADASGKGNLGNLKNGTSFVAGLNGNALQLDGIDDYADMGSNVSLELDGPLSISAWVKGNGIPTSGDSGILNLGLLNYALTYHTDSSVYFYIGDGGNQVHAPMSPNVWHHVVGTFDGTTVPGGMNLYVDGILVASRASAKDKTGAAANLWLGRYATSYFGGLLDDVTIYADILDADGVINEYCAVQALSGAATLPVGCQ